MSTVNLYNGGGGRWLAFSVNLTQAREDRTSAEKLAVTDWPGGKFVGDFLD